MAIVIVILSTIPHHNNGITWHLIKWMDEFHAFQNGGPLWEKYMILFAEYLNRTLCANDWNLSIVIPWFFTIWTARLGCFAMKYANKTKVIYP